MNEDRTPADPIPQSPHLNALAKQSFVIDNAYVTQPVCTPARSTITGLYPHANGCVGNTTVDNPSQYSKITL